MRCEDCREIVSAHVDGEDTRGESAAAGAHLAECSACRAFLVATEDLRRTTRVRVAEDVPDLTGRIVAATGVGGAGRGAGARHDPTRPVRIVLLCTALLQIGLALPALLLGDDAHLPVHIARHLGSFDVALAVGFLWVAWRPARALDGVFPVAVALVTCLVASSFLDVAAGRAAAGGELHHVTDLVGLAAMWLLNPHPIGRTQRSMTA
jgi:predicted anti-sigma-YlaC factor YlaD